MQDNDDFFCLINLMWTEKCFSHISVHVSARAEILDVDDDISFYIRSFSGMKIEEYFIKKKIKTAVDLKIKNLVDVIVVNKR